MDKYLITGFSGFVSRHFLEFLERNEIHCIVQGIDIHTPEIRQDQFKCVKIYFKKIDLLTVNNLDNIILKFQPDYILHLASYSSVAFSWKEPAISFANNTNIFLNLLDTVRILGLSTRILSVGSSEQYGDAKAEDMPLKENHPLRPISPYAVARVAQEMLSKIYADGYGLDIIMTRSFNHIGPYQKDIFVVSSFVRQLVEIKKRCLKGQNIIVGDLSIVRDFTDVRDIVSAYYNLLKNGEKGEVYNVCSGHGLALEEIVQKLCNILNVDVSINSNPQLIRPSDNKIIIGSNDKIEKLTGWKIQYSLEQSLKDIISYWQSNIS
jgi:GDP-4-dehydro-6-deoxy-D-mannose reductase